MSFSKKGVNCKRVCFPLIDCAVEFTLHQSRVASVFPDHMILQEYGMTEFLIIDSCCCFIRSNGKHCNFGFLSVCLSVFSFFLVFWQI